MTLTKQEQDAIEAEAKAHSDYPSEQRSYIAAATAYALKAKVLVEALGKIVNHPEDAEKAFPRLTVEAFKHIAEQALSTYKQTPTGE